MALLIVYLCVVLLLAALAQGVWPEIDHQFDRSIRELQRERDALHREGASTAQQDAALARLKRFRDSHWPE